MSGDLTSKELLRQAIEQWDALKAGGERPFNEILTERGEVLRLIISAARLVVAPGEPLATRKDCRCNGPYECDACADRRIAAEFVSTPATSLCSRTTLDAFLARYWPDLELRERSAPPPDDAWMIWYSDVDVSPEHFSGHGATEAARKRFDQAKNHWTVRLFRCVDQSGYGPPLTKSGCACPPDRCVNEAGAAPSAIRVCRRAGETSAAQTMERFCPRCNRGIVHNGECDRCDYIAQESETP